MSSVAGNWPIRVGVGMYVNFSGLWVPKAKCTIYAISCAVKFALKQQFYGKEQVL